MSQGDILLIADEEGRHAVRGIIQALTQRHFAIDRLSDELAVQRTRVHPASYRAILIALPSLSPYPHDTRPEQLPGEDWIKRDRRTGGIRALSWITNERAGQGLKRPRIYMGCQVAIKNSDIDYREIIRARHGIPFYTDVDHGRPRTADGTLTPEGAIENLLEFLYS